nr:hypothetical protein [Tanacetum cinerariifolium]
IAITLDLKTMEPEDSLRMRDEHLNTILETELDEFIKSSVENLVPSPSESEDESIAITLDLKTMEPEDSLRMRDEHLNTILETELDEFIKSSVENLVPRPSESEDECECDVPVFDDFTTFSNLFFDADGDFSSNDNESFFDEDISKEIYSNPLFDEEILSIKMDPHPFNAESNLIESLLFFDYFFFLED